MNQLPLQRRIVRQTLPNLTLFAAPNQTCRTKLIQTPLFSLNFIRFFPLPRGGQFVFDVSNLFSI